MTSIRTKPLAAVALFVLQAGLMPGSASAADFRAEFPPQYTDTPMGVNLQSGKFRYWPYSFSMGPFQLERGFNKSDFQFLGNSYVRTLPAVGGGTVTVRSVSLGDLSMDFVNPDGSWYYWWSTTSVGWKFKSDNPGFTLTDRSGNTYKYSEYGSYNPPKARVTLITYADGSTITVSYDASDRVTFLESNRGYAMRYEYLSGGAQVKVCGFNRTVTYATASTTCSASTYSLTLNGTVNGGFLQINSVVDLAGLTSTVTYTANSLRQCMTLPGSATCEFNNIYGPQPGEAPQATKADQVRIQTDANGNSYTYEYDNGPTGDDPPRYPGGPPVLSSASMNGPGFFADGYYENGLLTQLAAPGGGPSYFEYDGVNLKKARYADGRDITITRDYAGNAKVVVENPKPGGGASAITRTQTFPSMNLFANPNICQGASEKLCDKPTAQVDGRGNQTDYTYDAAHGGVLTMTLPAGANGIRPQTRYEYTQRYALVKNSGGSYVQASSPIWVKTRERFCKTTAASGQTCAGGSTDEVITDYDYGPTSGAANNLLLRGVAVTADGVTRRSCYGYDANGRKISETQPMASLSVCP
jgi:hypothetical protein